MKNKRKNKNRAYTISIMIFMSAVIISGLIFLVAYKLNDKTKLFQAKAAQCDTVEPLSKNCLYKYALDLDLDLNDFDTCVQDDMYVKTIEDDQSEGTKLGVQGTPAIYIGKGDENDFDGFLVGAGMGYEDLTELIDYTNSNSVDDSSKFWIKKQMDLMGLFEEQVREYFVSPQGGSLTGDVLEEEIQTVITQRTSMINSDHKARKLSVGEGHTKGSGEVILLVFSDYECPYCGQLAKDVISKLDENYIENDKLTLAFRDFPLVQIHSMAMGASNAAHCAGEQEMYFEYHNKLFGLE